MPKIIFKSQAHKFVAAIKFIDHIISQKNVIHAKNNNNKKK